jgi:hypothetical protein
VSLPLTLQTKIKKLEMFSNIDGYCNCNNWLYQKKIRQLICFQTLNFCSCGSDFLMQILCFFFIHKSLMCCILFLFIFSYVYVAFRV